MTALVLALYLLAVLEDGDYMNDWATHLSPLLGDATRIAGWLLALALGY